PTTCAACRPQQGAVGVATQGLPRHPPLLPVRRQAVLLPQEAQRLHHPAAVELERLRRLRALEERRVKGERTALPQAAVHLLHNGRLLFYQVDRVAEENGVHRLADELRQPLGAPLDEGDDGATDVL